MFRPSLLVYRAGMSKEARLVLLTNMKFASKNYKSNSFPNYERYLVMMLSFCKWCLFQKMTIQNQISKTGLSACSQINRIMWLPGLVLVVKRKLEASCEVT